MPNHSVRVSGLVGLLVLGTMAGGCGTALIGGDSQSILDLLSEYGITEDMTIADALNQITVGDVVTAFVDFADSAALAGGVRPAPGLTEEQIAELESLQAQLDAGEITEAEFTEAVHELIGDRGAGRPFAGFGFYGSPFGHRKGTRAADPLNLTEEQQLAAEEIFQLAHDDIKALRAAAHEEIRALLTEEQRAILDEQGHPVEPAVDRPPGQGIMGAGGRGGFVHGDFGPRHIEDELQLSEEQQTAIDEILAELHDAIEARHEQARDEFLALLTTEQLETVD